MDFRAFISIKEYELIELENNYKETKQDIIKMFKIQEKILNSTKDIRINATNCKNISPTCLAILSSVSLIPTDRKIRIKLEKSSKLMKSLIENGLINIEGRDKRNEIPLNRISSEEEATEIIEKLISLSPLKDLPDDIKATLHSKLFEIPSNSLTHSRSKYGMCCLGYYTNRKTFYFSIYDLGIGIPKAVREYTNSEEMDSIEAMKWALTEGNSTRKDDYPRGIGFTVLEDFRKKLHGKITLISEDVIYTAQDNRKNNFKKIENSIKGTLFTLKISV